MAQSWFTQQGIDAVPDAPAPVAPSPGSSWFAQQGIDAELEPRMMASHAPPGPPSTDPRGRAVSAPGVDEASFQRWYADKARTYGLNPSPDGQFYDYRAAFKAGAQPGPDGHWPSQFKQPGHPNEIVGGFNTRTGERVPGTPRASEQELISSGWEPATAKRLAQMPEPAPLSVRLTADDVAGRLGPQAQTAPMQRVGPTGAPARPQRTFSEALGSGVDQAQGMLYGAVEATGEGLGLERVQAFGERGRVQNESEIRRLPEAQAFTAIQGVGDFGQWLKETVGNQLPIMAPSMAGAAGGAAVGTVVGGPPGAAIGAVIGAFVPSFAMGVGEVQSSIKERGGSAPGAAFVGGSAIAALDSVLPGKIGGRMATWLGREAAEEVAKQALLKPAVKGMATEGITEALQEAIGEYATASGTGTPMDPNLGTRMIEVGAAGTLMGALGGVPTRRPSTADVIREGPGGAAAEEVVAEQMAKATETAAPIEPAAPAPVVPAQPKPQVAPQDIAARVQTLVDAQPDITAEQVQDALGLRNFGTARNALQAEQARRAAEMPPADTGAGITPVQAERLTALGYDPAAMTVVDAQEALRSGQPPTPPSPSLPGPDAMTPESLGATQRLVDADPDLRRRRAEMIAQADKLKGEKLARPRGGDSPAAPWQMTREAFEAEAAFQGVNGATDDANPSYWFTDQATEAREFAEAERGDPSAPAVRRTEPRIDIALRSALAATWAPSDRPSGSKHAYTGKERNRPVIASIPISAASDPHRYLVEQALQRGEQVPDDVLADYPDLARAAAATNTEGIPSGNTPPAVAGPDAVTASPNDVITAVDTPPPGAQTIPDGTAVSQGPSESTGAEGRAPGRGPGVSRPRVRTRAGQPTVPAITREQHRARLVDSLVADARAEAPDVDDADLRDELKFRLDLYDELQADARGNAFNPKALLEAIAKNGGIAETDYRGYRGELKRVKEGVQFGRMAGVDGIFRKRAYDDKGAPSVGLPLDVMLQRLQQFPEYQHIEDIDMLVDILDDIRMHGADVTDHLPGTEDILRFIAKPRDDGRWFEERWRQPVDPDAAFAGDGIDPEAGDDTFDPAALDDARVAPPAAPRPFTTDNLADVFNLPAEQASAVMALAEAMGLPMEKIELVQGPPEDAAPDRLEQNPTRLSVLHNLSAANLAWAATMGGLPVPSLAVVTPEADHDGYGEISLIGRKHLADPVREPVFDADAYTGRAPKPEYPAVKSKVAQPFYDALRPWANKFDDYHGETWDDLVNSPDPQKVVTRMARGPAAAAWFLHDELGIDVQPVVEPKEPQWQWSHMVDKAAFEAAKTAMDEAPGDTSEAARAASKQMHNVLTGALDRYLETPAGRKWTEVSADLGNMTARERLASRWGVRGEEWLADPDEMGWNVIRAVEEDLHSRGQKIVNRQKTSARVARALKGHEGAFAKWVDDKVWSLFGPPYIKVDGRKVPYTLSNIVDASISSRIAGKEQTMTFGEGKARASVSRRFSDVEHMRNTAGAPWGIRSDAAVTAAREASQKLTAAWRDAVVPYYGDRHERGFGSTWEGLDASMRAIARWVKGGRTAANLRKALRAEGFRAGEIDEDVLEQGVEAGKAMLETPVPYFEAKPQRAVRLNEFAGAVIPKKASAETRALLEKHGIPYAVYSSDKRRMAAVRAFTAKLAREGQETLFQQQGRGLFDDDTDILDTGEVLQSPGEPKAKDVASDEPGSLRQAQRDRPSVDSRGQVEAATDWLAAIARNESSARADEAFARTREPRQGDEQRQGLLANPDGVGLPLRAPSRDGAPAGPATADDGARASQERRRAGQRSGQPGSDRPARALDAASEGEVTSRADSSGRSRSLGNEVRPGSLESQVLALRGMPDRLDRAHGARALLEVLRSGPAEARAEITAAVAESVATASPLSDIEAQPRLPGDVGAVRNEERPTPKLSDIEDEFRLTPQYDKRRAKQTTLFQANGWRAQWQGAKAAVEFSGLPWLDDAKATIRALTKPDVSSPIHELAHVARRFLLNRDVPAEKRRGVSDEDIATIEQWAGAKDGQWDTPAEEKFSRGFEHYVRAGGPTLPSSIRDIFAKLAAWMTDVYQSITGSAIDVEITPEVRAVFDRLVTREERLAAEAVAKTEAAAPAKPSGPPRADKATGRKPGSWIIVEKSTGNAVREVFTEKAAKAVNTEKYEAVPAGEYLGEFNRRVKEAGGVQPPPKPTGPPRSKPATRTDAEMETLVREPGRAFSEAQRAYRAKEIGDAEFLEARKAFEASNDALDADDAARQTDDPVARVEQKAKQRLKDRGTTETLFQDGDQRSLPTDDRDDLLVIAAAKVARGRDRAAFDREMAREFGAGLPLADLFREGQTRAKTLADLDIDDYFNFRRIEVSDTEKDHLRGAITETVLRTGRVPKERESWEAIRAEAREMAPEVVEQLAPFQQMQAPFRAVRLIARERIATLNQEIYEGRLALEGLPGDSPEALQRERVLAEKEHDLRGLLDVWMRQRSEDGRNLAMHRMTVNSLETWYDPTFWVSKARRELGLPAGTQMPWELFRALQDILNRGRIAVETGQAVEPIQLELSQFMTRLQRSSLYDIIAALRRAGLLTGLKTHARNVVGNVAFGVLEETSRIPAVVLDFVIATATGQRTVHGVSPRAVALSSMAAAESGLLTAKTVFDAAGLTKLSEAAERGATKVRTGTSYRDVTRNESHRDYRKLNSGIRMIDGYVNFIGDTMGESDRVFKSYAFRRSMEEQAALEAINRGVSPVELLAKPSAEMWARAVADAEFATFNNPNLVAEGWASAKGFFKRKGVKGKSVAFVMDMAVPFSNTPANILSRMLDYTPVGLGAAGVQLGAAVAMESRKSGSWKQPTPAAIYQTVKTAMTPEQQRLFTLGISRGMVGSALIYLGYQLAAAGLASAMGGDDEGDRNVKNAAGILPGAVKFGDRWHQVATFSPAGNLVTLGATLNRTATEPLKNELRRTGKIAMLAGRIAMDQPMLKGVSDFVQSLNEPTRFLDSATSSFAGSFVPSFLNDAAGLVDPYRRETRPGGGKSSIWTGIQARVPWGRNGLPERLNVFGEKEPQDTRAIWDPTIATVARDMHDNVLRELVRHDVGIVWARQDPKETSEDFRRRMIDEGKAMRMFLTRVVESPAYRQRDDKAKVEMLEDAIRRGKVSVKTKRSGPPTRPRFQ